MFLAVLCNSAAITAAAVAQWVRAFAPQAESWVFESRLRQTVKVVKTVSDSSTAKRLAIGVSVVGPRMPHVTVGVAG